MTKAGLWRRSHDELEKVTLRLYKDDMEELRSMYGAGNCSLVIRGLIQAHIKKVKERIAERLEPVEMEPVDEL